MRSANNIFTFPVSLVCEKVLRLENKEQHKISLNYVTPHGFSGLFFTVPPFNKRTPQAFRDETDRIRDSISGPDDENDFRNMQDTAVSSR